jgi:hypothetical protein
MATIFDKIASLFKSSRNIDQTVDPKNNTAEGVSTENPSPYYGVDIDSTYVGYLEQTRASRVRIELYSQYLEMEEQFPEIGSGLDMYADYTISGGGIDTGESFDIKTDNEKMKQDLEEIEKRVRLKNRGWSITRSMCRDGDVFGENVIDLQGLAKQKILPSKTMYRVEDRYGNLNPDKAFIQKANSVTIEFLPWQITHYRLESDLTEIYGRSILYSVRRLCKELSLCEDALTIARLTRAHQRWKYVVDTTGMNSTQSMAYLEQRKMMNRKRRTIDPTSGRLMMQNNPLKSEEDIYIAKGKDSLDDVSPMNGDSSINNIGDVLHKYDRMFTAMGVSKAWFGLTGPNIRNVMSEQGLNFMRRVRRVRDSFQEGALKTYIVGLRVKGYTYEQIMESKITLSFPMMSHQDDEMRYKLDLVRLAVAEKMMTLKLIDRETVLTKMFKMSDDESKKLLKLAKADDPIQSTGSSPEASTDQPAPTATQEAFDDLLRKSQEFSALVDDIRDLSNHILESKNAA